MSNINQHLAREFLRRERVQQRKGKARDSAALEFFIGASAALTGKEASQASLASMLIASRGFSEVQRLADVTDAECAA